MPPKTRKHDGRAEELAGTEEEEYSVSSPLSEASTLPSASVTLTTDQLQMMLSSVLERFTAPSAVVPVAPLPQPKVVKVEVPKCKDEDIPSDFFTKWEHAQIHNGMPKDAWCSVLPVYLTGRAQSCFSQVHPSRLRDYELVKEDLLKLLGDTPDSADKKWWTLVRKSGETPGDFFQRVHSVGSRRMTGYESRDEVCDRMILSRYLSLLHPDCYSNVIARRPKTGQEAATMVQDYEEERAFARRHQFRPNGGQQNYSHGYKREQGSVSSGPSKGSGGGVNQGGNQGGSQASGTSGVTSNNSSGANQGNKQDKGTKRDRKPFNCFNCGEPGHLKANCPERIRRVRSPGSSKSKVITACIAGKEVQVRVDTGADRTLMQADLIPEEAYVDGRAHIGDYEGDTVRSHKLAKITIGVGPMEETVVVAVSNRKTGYPALLGEDISEEMQSYILGILKERLDRKIKEGMDGQVRVATRAQAAKEVATEQEDALVSAQSDCEPIQLSDVLDFPDSYFEQDPVPTPVSDIDTWPIEGVADLPLPDISCTDTGKLIGEQQDDPTLKVERQMALDRVKGYAYDKDVLVHYSSNGLEDYVQRVVVPVGRRKQVLSIAHSCIVAGHFGVKKTFARIRNHFLWPKMWGQVRDYVRTCEGCQKAARSDSGKAPLQPLPCISEPFSMVAFDLVGPLPRTTSGNRYVLTCMCLYTKFPEAIPLKRVDNITVLEAMVEVFARYGIPKVLLTDQGSVFTSKLTRHICKTFQVQKVQTSPYHPQTDGCLERWHACLKGMVKRADVKVKEWDQYLKYMLYAYREAPHCVTGFAPFTLMYGRDVRGPLEFLKTSWLEGISDSADVGEWFINVQAKMCEMAELVSDREKKAKGKMKQMYDKKATVKSFEEGDMVLVRIPIRRGKLLKAWEGPFHVDKKVSPVTYLVQMPGKVKKSKVLHCNLLRKWCTPVEGIHRVVICEEDEIEGEIKQGLKLVREDFVPSEMQQKQLDQVLERFSEVFSDKPGRTDVTSLCINTGDHKPSRSPPYRIPPRWMDDIRKQIDQLVDLGIVRPSTSPWSSSVVPVKKKDGGVRICVDFRAVNSVTSPDPYQMPRIEEILDMLSEARFMSKIDLTKGFHQIPVEAADCMKTAFCTPWGKFEFCYMPFGLRNGPAVFQRLMDRIMHLDQEWARVYIDDIVVFSASWEEHCLHLDKVLTRLKDAGLTANVKKCEWGQTQCEFLGHVVGKGRVSPAELKVGAVRLFPVPITKHQVRQFLGLTGYYRRFIPRFAEHSYTLTEATRKSAPDRVKATAAFLEECNYLKDALCALPSLTLPTPTDNYLLQTDASGVGLGAVLSVVRGEEELPVAFYSRKLLPRERRFSAGELEGLAVVEAVMHFEVYLITHPFTIETDHQALTFVNTARHQNGKLARWAIKLQPFSFTVRYRLGALNGNADALSRLQPEEMQDSPPSGQDHKKGGSDVMMSPPQVDSRTA